MAGLIASLVLAPLSLVIDQWLMSRGVDTDDDFLLGRPPQAWVILFGLCEEWVQVIGPTLLVSTLLGVPAWWARLGKHSHVRIK
jgi:hypothetical protein